jgi:hypothetical protein
MHPVSGDENREVFHSHDGELQSLINWMVSPADCGDVASLVGQQEVHF